MAHELRLLEMDLAMATRMNMLKLLQEMRGLSELGRPHQSPKPSALYLIELRRSRAAARRPKRRIVIQFSLEDVMEMETPVKITHRTAGDSALSAS